MDWWTNKLVDWQIYRLTDVGTKCLARLNTHSHSRRLKHCPTNKQRDTVLYPNRLLDLPVTLTVAVAVTVTATVPAFVIVPV